jgi:hypothetical protein
MPVAELIRAPAAEPLADEDEVRMGYGPCSESGCTCQAYVRNYNDPQQLCSTCSHTYEQHR